MENEIKVGEWIRTRYGNIEKVKYISKYDDGDIHINTMRGVIYYRPREIVKHSPNLIDLIEVGDFVGNCEIQYIHKNEKGETLLENDDVTLTEKDIKTIVTKEQYKSIEYKVEE